MNTKDCKLDLRRDFGAVQAKTALNVLLIEDSSSDVYAVRRALEKSGKHSYRITTAGMIAEAEAALSDKGHAFDVILLDLGLPDTSDSRDTFSRLRTVAETIPVIILTSMEDHDQAVRFVKDGAEDYFRKSMLGIAPEALYDAIEFAVCRHQNLLTLKEEKDQQLKEKDRMIEWVTGSYSVQS